MTQRSKKPGITARKNTALKKSIKVPRDEIPPFHIMDKKDLEKELSRIETEFGMTPEEFHKAWREGKVHGHEAMKLNYYYKFYKDEYE
ncbi:MAG: hypothetical protein A2W22_00055 [Candidatus Levybacteria bacterium RBG_16_35_11]|nr:MAG: hypothetical protein A2W22_00055 [Candidatus Levybacteria bacterium RBG_16_35_11]